MGSETADFFFFNDTATTEIYTLSLHDALPISEQVAAVPEPQGGGDRGEHGQGHRRLAAVLVHREPGAAVDRKSTRLNSSHANISYAVFCLKKKKLKVDNFAGTMPSQHAHNSLI